MLEHKKLKNVICSVEQLLNYVDLSPNEKRLLQQVVKIHPMQVSLYYMSLIDWNDPHDPIRKMAIPCTEELNPDGSYDTSGEAENTKMPGLQHKYAETALILATNRCATYCRHCFRKRLVGLPTEEIVKRFEKAAKYIEKHKEINNVLISGGDPLVLSNEVIKTFLDILSRIDHISFIRFGSRTPVTLPSRLSDPELLGLLEEYSQMDKRLYVVAQFNHPKEITPQSIGAVNKLINAGVVMSNQTVLLKGVNDDPETLATLMNKLARIGVTPYYLFQCRPVKRVKTHFQIPIAKGIKIVEKAKGKCNGQSKRFRYVMSHTTGKIEILGILDGEIYFKYHEAKNRNNIGVMFKRRVSNKAGWLDDFNSA